MKRPAKRNAEPGAAMRAAFLQALTQRTHHPKGSVTLSTGTVDAVELDQVLHALERCRPRRTIEQLKEMWANAEKERTK